MNYFKFEIIDIIFIMYFLIFQQDAIGEGFSAPSSRRGEKETQIEEAGPEAEQLFHGCEMPRVLCD